MRKQKPVRELPGRSARPATYKDGSSDGNDSNDEDDEEVSIGMPTTLLSASKLAALYPSHRSILLLLSPEM